MLYCQCYQRLLECNVEGDKISFLTDNKENILSIGHEIKYGGEENMGHRSLFQTWL